MIICWTRFGGYPSRYESNIARIQNHFLRQVCDFPLKIIDFSRTSIYRINHLITLALGNIYVVTYIRHMILTKHSVPLLPAVTAVCECFLQVATSVASPCLFKSPSIFLLCNLFATRTTRVCHPGAASDPAARSERVTNGRLRDGK